MWCEYEIVIFEFTVNERLGLKEDQGATVFGEGDPGSQKLQKNLLLENHEIWFELFILGNHKNDAIWCN